MANKSTKKSSSGSKKSAAKTASKTTQKKTAAPQANAGLNRFKMEAANEVGVTLKQGYNGHLTSKQAGSIGGQMVKKMVQQYQNKTK